MLGRAGQWFLDSGIQQPQGGVARYYHTDTGKNAPVSTEITGYAVSALCYAYRRTRDARYLQAGRLGGHFLAQEAWNRELRLFPFEIDPPTLSYFFDTGIIVRGLLSLWRITGDALLLQRATDGAWSMSADFATGPVIHPILHLPQKSPLPYESGWSRGPGCYQLKSAMAWREVFEITGEREFEDRYEHALAAALESHESFLPAETPEKTMDRLHAYCYFLEGLTPVADRPECRDAFRTGIQRVSHYLRQIRPVFVRSDVYAQLLRARLYGGALAGIAVDEGEAREEAAAMEAFQSADADTRLDGGYYFGRRAGVLTPFMNPVSTAFCSQAMDMWEQYLAGTFEADRKVLI